MRALVILMLVSRVAAATPVTTTCYAGSETSDGSTTRLVIERELDRDKHEIRSHRWRETNVGDEVVVTWTVASDGKTFSWKHGTGTLKGAPWKWSSAHFEADLLGEHGTTDETFASDRITATSRFEKKDGTLDFETTVDAAAFDCKDLKKQITALDDTAPDAKHACYAGKDSTDKPVVVDQITEPKRVQIVTTRPHGSGRIVMSIEGAKIFVKNPQHRSWTGTGTITGKPGAWTGYEYTVTIGKIDIRAEGTLGGPKFTFKTTGQNAGAIQTTTIDADAFDCKDLAARRAALSSSR